MLSDLSSILVTELFRRAPRLGVLRLSKLALLMMLLRGPHLKLETLSKLALLLPCISWAGTVLGQSLEMSTGVSRSLFLHWGTISIDEFASLVKGSTVVDLKWTQFPISS